MRVKFRKSISLTLVSLVLASSLIGNQSALAGRVISPDIKQLGLFFTENMELTTMTSVIYGRTDNSSDENYRICKTATDDTCNAATDLMIIQYFALCEKDADINCIEEVWARDVNGVKIPGVYQRHLPASGDADFPGEPRMNLPASKGSGFVVKFAGVKHSGGTDEYLVALRNFTRVFKKNPPFNKVIEPSLSKFIGLVPWPIINLPSIDVKLFARQTAIKL